MASKWETVKGVRKRELERTQARASRNRQQRQEAVDSLNQILQYIGEYREQMERAEQDGVPVSSLSRLRRFLQQLVQASAAQEQLLIQLSVRVQEDQASLMRCRADLKAVEKLQDNEIASQKRELARRESRDNDELARRRFLADLRAQG